MAYSVHLLAEIYESIKLPQMKFMLAVAVFVLFAFFLGWGIVLLLAGKPILFTVALLAFLGTFIKYGCLSH